MAKILRQAIQHPSLDAWVIREEHRSDGHRVTVMTTRRQAISRTEKVVGQGLYQTIRFAGFSRFFWISLNRIAASAPSPTR